jgi:hypothetical protein
VSGRQWDDLIVLFLFALTFLIAGIVIGRAL